MKSSSHEDKNVSEDMLRLVVDEAQRSVAGIDTAEGRMIKAVLDMQDTAVGKIMQPRVDIIGVPESATANDILSIVVESRYSRIPVYRGDKGLDNVVGVVYSKDLLETFSKTLVFDEIPYEKSKNSRSDATSKSTIANNKDWNLLIAADIMEPSAYFIPETMTAWNALQEMRKRRLHLAIVVDEYGGTAGLVTFEDILEEVVGEIYDEFDDEEEAVDLQNISRRVNSDGTVTFEMKGVAYLDDVFEALGLERSDEDSDSDYATIGGFLCSQAGAIPSSGDAFVYAGYKFIVGEVEDNRRILTLTAEKLRENHAGNGESSHFPVFLPWNQNPSNQIPDSEVLISTGNESHETDFSGNKNNTSSSLTFRDGEWVERGSD